MVRSGERASRSEEKVEVSGMLSVGRRDSSFMVARMPRVLLEDTRLLKASWSSWEAVVGWAYLLVLF